MLDWDVLRSWIFVCFWLAQICCLCYDLAENKNIKYKCSLGVVENVFKIGSFESGAMLYEAMKEFEVCLCVVGKTNMNSVRIQL